MSQFNVSVRIDAVDGVTPTLSKINTGLGTFKQAIAGVRTSTGQLIGTEFSGAMARFNQPLTVATEKVAGFRDRLSQMGGILSTQATSFGVATASVWGIYNAYDSLTKVQIRASAAALRVQTLTTTLHSLTERLRIAREKGNLTDEQMAVLQERITDTTGKLNVAQERSADIAQDVQEAWAGFVTTVGPQAVAATASLVQLGSVMKSSFKDTGGFINTLKSTFSGLLPSFKSVGSSSLLLGQNIGNLVPKADQATGALSKMKNALGGIGVGGALLGGGILALGGFLVALGIDIVNTSKKIAELQLELKHLEVGSTAAFENMKAQSDAFFNSMGGQIDSFLTTTGATKAIPFGNLIENVMGAANLEKDAATFKAEFSKTLDGIMSSATTTLAGELSPDVKNNIEKGVARLRDYLIDTSKKNFASPASFMNTIDVMKPIAEEIQRQSEELANLVAGGKVDVTGLMTKQTAEVNKFAEAIVKDLGGATKAASYPAAILSSTIDTLVQTMVDGGAAPPELANAIKTAANDIIKSSDDVDKNLATITKTVGLTGVGIRHMGDEIAYTTDKTNPFNAGLALATRTISESDAMLLQYNNTLKSSGTFTDLFGDKEKIVQEGRAKFAETNKLFLHGIELTNEEFNRTIDAENGNIKALDELAHSTTQTTDAMNEQLVALLNNNAESINYTRALTDVNMNQRLIAQGFEAGTKQAQEFFDNLVKGTEQEQDFDAALATGASSLGIHSNLLAFSSGKMQELIKTTYEQSKGFRTLSLEAAKSTSFLKDQTLVLAQVNAGMLAGIQSANDWAISNVKATAEAEAFHGRLLQIVADMTGLSIPTSTSNEALQKMATTIGKTHDAGLTLAEMMTDKLAPSFERVSGLIQSKDMKELRENLKNMELPKGFGKGVDDAFKPLQGAAKTAREAGNAMDVLVTAGENMSKKDLAKNTDAFAKSLDKLSKVKGTSKPVDDILDSLKTMTPEQLGQHTESFNFLKESIDEFGKLRPDEAQKFLDMFNAETKTLGPNSETAAAGVDKLSTAFGTLVTKGSAAADLLARAEANFDPSKSRFRPDTTPEQDKGPTKATLDISEATANITHLIGNFNGWLAVAAKPSIAILKIDTATASITHLIGNFSGWFNMANTKNPAMKANPVPATQSITKAINNFQGWFNKVSGANPPIKANPVPATQAITKVIDNFQGWINKINQANPAIKANNSDAMSKINSVKSALGGLSDKTVTVHVKVDDPKNAFGHASGGIEYASKSTHAVYGEAGPEIAAFFPLRTSGQPRKGDYDITVPSPVLDTSGIRNALSGLGGPIVTNNNAARTGPSTVYISIPVYLAEGLAPLKTFVRKVVLDDLGMFPST